MIGFAQYLHIVRPRSQRAIPLHNRGNAADRRRVAWMSPADSRMLFQPTRYTRP